MITATFDALPVVDSPSAALALTVGDNFLFTVDAWQQNNTDINRITYWTRIEADRSDGPFPLSPSILENFTRMAQPVSAGGPFPPSGAGYPEIYFPADGVLKGQGRTGYVRVHDIKQ